jgi:hypothetical protein
MPEIDLTARVGEQLRPIIETMESRIQATLSERDKTAIAHALMSAALAGGRITQAAILANTAEAGFDVSGLNTRGFADVDLWPFPE